MTRDHLRIPAWAIPVLVSAIVALAVAWSQLGGKEDSAAHAADVVVLQGAIATVRTDAEKRDIRDSAFKAETRSMLRDLACPTNPTRDYCK